MISFHRLTAAIIAIIALAGCAREAAAPAPTLAPGARQPTAWDGTYRGPIRITGTGRDIQRAWCETDPVMEVDVSNGTFTYRQQHPNEPGQYVASYVAVVSPDGSVSAQLASGTLTARVSGTQMTGTIDGAACLYAFTLNRV